MHKRARPGEMPTYLYDQARDDLKKRFRDKQEYTEEKMERIMTLIDSITNQEIQLGLEKSGGGGLM